MVPLTTIIVLGAFVLSVAALVRSEGKSLEAWAALLLSIALLIPRVA